MFESLKRNEITFFRSLHTIQQLCTIGCHVFAGHGHSGNVSDVDRAIKALEPVIDSNFLDMNEEKCLETWKSQSSASSFPSEETFWVEWDQFLKVSIVQSNMFLFAKLIDEHEH